MYRSVRYSLILLWIITLALIAGCSSTPEILPEAETSINLVDGRGEKIVLANPAMRIVSVAPSNTEILFAIGAGGVVVGRDEFSDYPEQTLEIQSIGGGWGAYDTETILSLEPDLVLAADILAAEQLVELDNLGLRVFLLPNPTNFIELFENIRSVGQLTGREEAAAELVTELAGRVRAVEVKILPLSYRPSVFYELDASDPNAPWTTGKGTFIDTLIEQAGGFNIGAQVEGEWAQISIETLIDQDPAVIILGDYTWGGITPEMVAARPGWEAIAAVQMGQVYTIDDNLISRPGPRLVDGLETMAKLLHPNIIP